MTSADEQMLKHTNDLFDRIRAMGVQEEHLPNIDQIHNQQLEPPEERPCEPGKHEPDWDSLRKTPLDMTTVVIDCESCQRVAYYDLSGVRWEEWMEL
jgi:hypothetical protein